MKLPLEKLKRLLTDWHLQETLKKMRDFWSNLPEQIKRLVIVITILIVVLLIVRSEFIPEDFGEHGHYRASAVEEIVAQPVHFAGQVACADCHDDITIFKRNGFHKNLSCEVCHGPAAAHIEDPEENIPPAPRERGYCPLCHEYIPSRPTGFPQIVSTAHNPMSPCISCHDPHDPEPPETPKDCGACHAEIASTKALSHHIYIPCTYCHETPEEHRLLPHEIKPGKPQNREFCGRCHANDEQDQKGIPQIDLNSHEVRYVCWQCHYPHLPETQ